VGNTTREAVVDASGVPLSGKAATQERILQAATALFLEQGYEQTTVAQVAERAGVSRATVFWHFSDKAGLFREAFNRLVEPFRRSIDQGFEESDPEKRLQELLTRYPNFIAEHREAILGFVRWAMEAQDFRRSLVDTLLDMHQRYIGAITETLAEITPEGEDPRALAVALMGLIDIDTVLSVVDDSERRSEERKAAVDAVARILPRKVRPAG
jgi:AcrR family transcriptional regulator